jgi:hypothetical protein
MMCNRDPRALLMFSGGETRQEAGPKSEGQSYWIVADAADWYGGCRLLKPFQVHEGVRKDEASIHSVRMLYQDCTRTISQSSSNQLVTSTIPVRRLFADMKTLLKYVATLLIIFPSAI